MGYIVYDTETTGFPNWSAPSDHPSQPHLVEIAVVVVDDAGTVQSTWSSLVRPNGWTIPEKLTQIHGITDDMCRTQGLPLDEVMKHFMDLWHAAEFRVGHSEGFDARMVRSALMRLHGRDARVCDQWKGGNAYCTMHGSRKTVGATGKNGQVKAPTLVEASAHFMGAEGLDHATAHRALSDAKATADIFRRMVEQGIVDPSSLFAAAPQTPLATTGDLDFLKE